MIWQPILSRRQEALLAYADALEVHLRDASELLLGPVPAERREAVYQPLKVERYERLREDAMREGLRDMRKEDPGRDWEDRERKRREKKEPPRPAREVMARGGVILGDPGGGKSELLRQEVLRRVGELRRAVLAGRAGEVAFPLFLSIPQMPRFLDVKVMSWLRQDVWGGGEAPGETGKDGARLVALAALFRQCIEWNLSASTAGDLVRHLWLLWRKGGAKPFIALDSWDELEESAVRQNMRPVLKDLVRRDGATLTSRVVGFTMSDFSGHVWRLLPFTLEEAQALVSARLGRTAQAQRLNGELKAKPQVAALASNPLALTLIIKIFGSDNPLELPEKRGQLYERVINDLLGEPEARRRGRDPWTWEASRREKRRFLEHLAWCGYPKVGRTHAEFGAILRQVCEDPGIAEVLTDAVDPLPGATFAAKLRHGLLQDHGLLVRFGNGELAFVHKALLDYLAARFLARIINEKGFDGQVPVVEDGRAFTVTVKQYLKAKGWCPKHFEVIALLGNCVNSLENLLRVIVGETPDDIQHTRMKLGLAVGAEMPKCRAMSNEVVQEIVVKAIEMLFREEIMGIRDIVPEEIGISSNVITQVISRLDAESSQVLRERAADVLDALAGGMVDGATEVANSFSVFLAKEKHVWTRSRVARAFGVICSGAGYDCNRIVWDFIGGLRSESHDEMLSSFSGGLGTRGTRVMMSLLAELRMEGLHKAREKVAGAFPALCVSENIGGDEIIWAVVSHLEMEKSTSVREGLSEALKPLCKRLEPGGLEISRALISRLDQETSEAARCSLVNACCSLNKGLRADDPSSLQRLVNCLESEKAAQVRLGIAETIELFCSGEVDAEMLRQLVFCLNSEESEFVRSGIVSALKSISVSFIDRATFRCLVACLNREGSAWQRMHIAEALCNLGRGLQQVDVKIIQDLEDCFRKEEFSLCRSIIQSALQVLGKGMTVDDSEVPQDWIRDLELYKLEPEIYRKSIVKTLRMPYDIICGGRIAIARSLLARVRGNRRVPYLNLIRHRALIELSHGLTDDFRTQMILVFIEGLTDFSNQSNLKGFLDVLFEACRGLSRIEPKVSLALIRHLEMNESMIVRRRVAEILGAATSGVISNAKEVTWALLKRLQLEESHSVRWKIADALCEICRSFEGERSRFRSALVEILKADESEYVRASIVEVLCVLGRTSSVDAGEISKELVMRLFLDVSDMVCRIAAEGLAEMFDGNLDARGSELAPALVARLSVERSSSVKDALCRTVGSMGLLSIPSVLGAFREKQLSKQELSVIAGLMPGILWVSDLDVRFIPLEEITRLQPTQS
ncbi:MAG: hypothetical protein JJU00_15810 [Opitutales bacterium]|nr:hypothetical protein [Opitutales bacterium]